ncbi:hypothetical protein HPP92_028924 [Vanilla planifolia]|uniref:Uncharacterized protein n=1 Tax=Vanilla planifolia TaxID=51239 RepID=A0A835P668_VANPL|nr:hypothetical protein HPP92_028924 [Vanilla planifolia]
MVVPHAVAVGDGSRKKMETQLRFDGKIEVEEEDRGDRDMRVVSPKYQIHQICSESLVAAKMDEMINGGRKGQQAERKKKTMSGLVRGYYQPKQIPLENHLVIPLLKVAPERTSAGQAQEDQQENYEQQCFSSKQMQVQQCDFSHRALGCTRISSALSQLEMVPISCKDSSAAIKVDNPSIYRKPRQGSLKRTLRRQLVQFAKCSAVALNSRKDPRAVIWFLLK